MEILVSIIGGVLIWGATDIGRGKESEIKFGSKKWWFQLLLITTGIYLIGIN